MLATAYHPVQFHPGSAGGGALSAISAARAGVPINATIDATPIKAFFMARPYKNFVQLYVPIVQSDVSPKPQLARMCYRKFAPIGQRCCSRLREGRAIKSALILWPGQALGQSEPARRSANVRCAPKSEARSGRCGIG